MKIAFYGGGNIAQAFIEGLLRSGYKKNNIFFVDRNLKNQKLLKKLKIRNLNSQKSLKIDLFILAVKPKDAINAYQEILRDYKNPKIISFVAGIKTSKYKTINKNIEFLRAMPNTSSKFNLGITAIYNLSFNETNLAKVISIMKRVGMVISLKKESKIDTFTGVIGSGPAYFFYLLKTYEKKLLKLCDGDKEEVNKIIVSLIKGVGSSIEDRKDLDGLIKSVASKKGTTEAGLKSFKSNKISMIFEKGLNAAIKRSKEISSEY